MTETAVEPGKARLLHTMIRVKDLDKSLNFYTELLGMKLLRKRDYPTGKFTLAFVGYGEETDSTVIELTHNWEQAEPYNLGSAFGHLAIGVPDVYKACEKLAASGVKIPRPAGPMAHGGSVIAFIEDPDGYRIELVQLGFPTIRLLTNNPDKVAALERYGIQVAERMPHVFPTNGHNERYLRTKATRSGHLL